MKRKRNYFTIRIPNGIIQSVNDVRKFTAAERAWIRLMQNPYASLSLREADEEDAIIVRPDHSMASSGNSSEPPTCPPSL